VLPLVLTGAHAESKAMDLKTYEHVKFELAELIRSGQLIASEREDGFEQTIRGGASLAVTAHSFGRRPVHRRRLPDGLVVESLP